MSHVDKLAEKSWQFRTHPLGTLIGSKQVTFCTSAMGRNIQTENELTLSTPALWESPVLMKRNRLCTRPMGENSLTENKLANHFPYRGGGGER